MPSSPRSVGHAHFILLLDFVSFLHVLKIQVAQKKWQRHYYYQMLTLLLLPVRDKTPWGVKSR